MVRATRQIGAKLGHFRHAKRVKGHQRDEPLIACERSGGGLFERTDVGPHIVILVLDFDQKGRAAGDLRKDLGKGWNRAVATFYEADAGEMRRRCDRG